MGRWRPPQKRGANYITPAGFIALQQEQKDLWIKRREVVAALSAAAAEGDRSENAEYIYRKKELAGIDRRIRYLKKRLEELQVVDQPPADPQRVYFAAMVALEDEQGATRRLQIVGPDEANPELGTISMDAPLARALLGKRLDDACSVRLPGGLTHYIITDIDYA